MHKGIYVGIGYWINLSSYLTPALGPLVSSSGVRYVVNILAKPEEDTHNVKITIFSLQANPWGSHENARESYYAASD